MFDIWQGTDDDVLFVGFFERLNPSSQRESPVQPDKRFSATKS